MSKKKRSDQQPAVPAVPGSAEPPSRRFPGTARVLLAAALAVVAVFQGPKWLGSAMRSQARRALAARDAEAAHQWLNRADWLQDDADTEFLRARAFRKQGRFEQVRVHLERAWKAGYDIQTLEREQWLALAQSGQLREAEPHLRILLLDPRGDGAEICEAYVNGFFLNHRIPEALRLIDSWAADYPDDPQPVFLKGKILNQRERFAEAERCFRAALQRDPDHAAAALQLGEVLTTENRPEEALPFFQKAASNPRHSPQALVGAVRCHRLMGRIDEAEWILKKVFAAGASDPKAFLELGQVRLSQDRTDDAVSALRKAGELAPRDREIRYALATALRRVGNDAEAAEHFQWVSEAQEAISRADLLAEKAAVNPHDAETRYEVGMAHLAYGSPDRGVTWLQSALNANPEHTAAHRALAEYYERRADESDAFRRLAAVHRRAAAAERPESPP